MAVAPLDPPALIGLDWGTSSLRGYAIASDGTIAAERSAALGIMQVRDGNFAEALNQFCGDWLAAWPAAALMACGMIGSKQGWHEAPYCPCPSSAALIGNALVAVPLTTPAGDSAHRTPTAPTQRLLHIVPGVSRKDELSGVPDVMRGEETQIIGAVPATGSHLVLLPGTHSKWARVAEGVIEQFTSVMTGEVFAALVGHTILGRLMATDAPHDAASFARGVRYGFAQPDQLLSRLFSARTLGLFGELSANALPSYLSGMLIGAEIAGAIGTITDHTGHTGPLLLLGSEELVARYGAACALVGLATDAGSPRSAAYGLWRLAKAARLVD